MVDEFPSNSNHDREEKVKPAKTRSANEPKKIEQITENKAVRRKPPLGKRMKNLFFGGDARGALGFVAMDVLIPAAKDMIADAGREAIERMVFGESRRSRGFRGSPGHVRYDGYSRQGNSSYGAPAWRSQDRPTLSHRDRATHNFDEIILDTRGEAEQVIDTLGDIVQQYNQASVADLYELVGISPAYTDNKYGWTDLRGSSVSPVRGGAYLLNLPRPVPLD